MSTISVKAVFLHLNYVRAFASVWETVSVSSRTFNGLKADCADCATKDLPRQMTWLVRHTVVACDVTHKSR